MPYIERIVNADTGETRNREFSAEEAQERAATERQIETAYSAAQAEKAMQATARAALLNRLGITEDEAALLAQGL